VFGVLPATALAVPPDPNRTDVTLVDLPTADKADEENDPELAGQLDELTTADVPEVDEYDPTAVAVPASDEATQSLTTLTPGTPVQLTDLPSVEVGAPQDATAAEADALEGSWHVALTGQDTLATDTQIEGVALTVTPPAAATGDAVISLDYTDFAELYGANWADRLNFVQYPACFLTTPDTEGCSEPTEVDTENVVDQVSTNADGTPVYERHITATVDAQALAAGGTSTATASTASADSEGTVTDGVYRKGTGSTQTAALTAGSGSGSSVLLATDSGSGSKGDFSASPLVSAGSWSAGGNSGGFNYTYNLEAPTVPGGPSPSISFGYNSQIVDGRTSATNNQPSWIGDGWEYNPGSITRTYKSCRDDLTDGNNADHKTSDMCWGSYNATMTLGGTTTELVLPDDTDAVGDDWVTANGDGSRVELVKNTAYDNGDDDGEYWVVTTRDGTQYWFGRNELPGWTSGKDTTDSVLTVPVAGNQSGEPGYAGTGKANFAKSFTDQAWRWNLDYVVDTNGNAMSLWYGKETNYYAKNQDFKNPVTYDRGGYLKKIQYGQRSDTLYSANPIAEVDFAVDERCFKEGDLTCTEANFTSGDFANNRIWYDTPADLYCSGKSGDECFVPVPTFWSRKRLATVTTKTQRTQGSTALTDVDRWTLNQSLPSDLTDEGTALWLESITRQGVAQTPDEDGQYATATLQPVSFVANTESMPNRVREGSADQNPVFDRLRIGRVVSEYGGETIVHYSTPTDACKTGSGFPTPKANTGLCFPAYWHADPDKADETISWFNKYVVDYIEEKANLAGVDDMITDYQYVGDAAWTLNQAEFSKKKTRTYDVWRGYALVNTITGADAPSTYTPSGTTTVTPTYTGTAKQMSATRYFRGLDDESGDAVYVKDAAGANIARDYEAYAGMSAEELTYESATASTWLTRSVDIPARTLLGSRTRGDGIPALKAWRVTEPETLTYTKASGTNPDDSRTQRVVREVTDYESTYGLPVTVHNYGDVDKTTDDTCTVMSYVHNTTKHLIGLAKQVLTTTGSCDDAASAPASAWVSGSRTAYDSLAYGETPTTGLATETFNVTGAGGGWASTGTLTYADDYGRVTSTTDATGKNPSTIEYTPSTGQVYSVTTSNQLKQTETTTVDPARGTTLTSKDANSNVTSYQYDPLGRSIAAWSAGKAPASDPASVAYTYNTDPGAPVSVVTSTLTDDGSYDESVVIYDGLGRERQTQAPAVGGGRLVTDIFYTANGTVEKTNNAYYVDGDPSTTLFDLDSDYQVPNATLYSYDGLGRELSETPYEHGTPKPDKAEGSVFGLDYSISVEPVGTPSQRTWSDALGRTTRIDTFTNTAHTTFRSTYYTYDQRGDQVQAKDNKDNIWSRSYDARGRLLSSHDPDTGTTEITSYDVLDRPVTTKDARGVIVRTAYDALSRPTAQYQVSGSTETQLTAYAYDSTAITNGVGQPYSATRYTDGNAYTTAITGYDSDYQVTGKKITLPTLIASTYGLKSEYAYTYEYSDTGLANAVTLPDVGALGSEKVVTRYNEDGLPISTSGADYYTAETSYSPYGEVLRTVTGSQPYRVWNTNLYSETSGELTQTITDRESTTDVSTVSAHRVDSRTYAYDNSGNVVRMADAYGDGTNDRQCFTYDILGQLTEAWTSPNAYCLPSGKTTAEAVYSDGTVNVTSANAGYWQSYTYDELGNRKKLVKHNADLATAKDTTVDYNYPTTTSTTTTSTQPHTLTSMSSTYTTDAGAQVTEAASTLYDASGNAKTRTYGGDTQSLTWTWDGKLDTVTGFGDSGAGAWLGLAGKCLDLAGADTTAGTAVQLYACNGSKAQKFRIEPASTTSDATSGALKILGKCVMPKSGATASGTAVVVADCTGAANQKWTVVSSGHKLKYGTTSMCLDVPSSNSANGTDLQLYACDTNGTAQSWAPANETKYIYGPDGERLLAVSATEHTLYLGDTTVSTDAAGAHSYTERYYGQAGAPTVMRRITTTSTTSSLTAEITDQHGTAIAEVNLSSGNTVRFSKRDPFGNERSEANTWYSHKGYVGGDEDTSTDLTHLGAREYDSATGRFTSADPVLDITDPLQMNGYAYCQNNPLTYDDASGLQRVDGGGGGSDGGPSSSDVAAANRALHTSLSDIILSVGWAVLKEFIGWNDVVGCFSRGDLWSCGSLLMDAIPWGAIFSKGRKIWRAIDATMSAISAWRKAKAWATKVIAAAKAAAEAARAAKAAAKAAAKRAAQAAAKKARRAAAHAVKNSRKAGNAVQKAAKKAAEKVRKKEASGSAAGSCKTSDAVTNSFTPGTLVLMADGSTKPIKDVKNGDRVLATDPETGESTTETVTAEIKGQGLKHLVKVTIDLDGDKGTKTASVTATEGHPFWVADLKQWVTATDLKSGEWLRTSAGTHVQITAVKRWTTPSATVHNLTVSSQHTYYVLAGTTSVLVHNCGGVGLGYQKAGAAKWADDNGFDHFMKNEFSETWSTHVKNAIDDPNTIVHVYVEEFTGSFEGMATRGLAGGAGVHATQQEMSWIARAVVGERKTWNQFQFYDRKGPVDMPEPKWHDGKWYTAWTLEWA
jgi:RHS repeat-associated protein